MSQEISDFYAVIPAGGIGSRLWPLSRADAPKFLHDLTGSGHSLLRDTWDRLAPLAGSERIAVVTGRWMEKFDSLTPLAPRAIAQRSRRPPD